MLKNRLLDIRLQLGYRHQHSFAEYLGVHKYQYNRYENNVVQPSLEVIYKIAKKLGKPIEDIIYDDGVQEP